MTHREAVARCRAEFAAALNRQDIAALSNLRDEDCIDMPPNRPAIRGLNAIQAYWREGFAQAETRFTVFPDQLDIDGDTAIDRFRWSAESAPLSGGDSVHDEGICLWTWRRQNDGAWKLAQAIWNSDLPQGQIVWTAAAAHRASPRAPALTAEDRETLRDIIERQWTSAWLARDWDRILAMSAPDIVYMPAGHPVLRGHDELRAWLEQFPKTVAFEQPVEHLEGDGYRTVARTTFAAAIEIEGQRSDVAGKVLCTAGKDASGRWLAQSVCVSFDHPMPMA